MALGPSNPACREGHSDTEDLFDTGLNFQDVGSKEIGDKDARLEKGIARLVFFLSRSRLISLM